MLSSAKKDPKDNPPPSDSFAKKLVSPSPSSALVIAKQLNPISGASVSAMLSSSSAITDKEIDTPQSDSLEESKSGANETRLSLHESMESLSQSQSELALSITDISIKVLPNKIEIPNESDIPETTDLQSSPSEVGPWSRHGKKYLSSNS